MDREPPKTDEVRRLIAAADAARGVLRADVALLRHKLDVPARVRGSLKLHPGGWLISALGAGFAVSLLLRRRSSRGLVGKHRKGVLGLLFGLALTVMRPFAKVWLTGQLKTYLATQLGSLGTRYREPSALRASTPL